MTLYQDGSLEVFLMWHYDLIVDGDGSGSPTLTHAEMNGKNTRRRHLCEREFQELVCIFADCRMMIEKIILDSDDPIWGWRTYTGAILGPIDRIRLQQGRLYLNSLNAAVPASS